MSSCLLWAVSKFFSLKFRVVSNEEKFHSDFFSFFPKTTGFENSESNDDKPEAVFYFRSELELDRDVLTDCEQLDQK